MSHSSLSRSAASLDPAILRVVEAMARDDARLAFRRGAVATDGAD